MFKRLCVLVVFAFAALANAADPALIPWPKEVKLDGGRMELNGRIIATDPKFVPLAKILSADIYRMTGVTLPPAEGKPKPGDVTLGLSPATKMDGAEYNRLVLKDTVDITAYSYRGVVWGTSTLLQAIEVKDGKLSIPTGEITDEPDIKMRSAECDIARKWHPIANLYELVDLFRFYKVDHIMLHLNDHGMFTFGSELYPELAQGRKADGPRHYYTKAELKDLVAYARDRGVTIIPEIEMPGHSDAGGILPKIFGTKDPATGEYKGGPVNVLREDTVAACSKLLNEVMDVFNTAEYVSIGSDEVNDAAYNKMSEYPAWKEKHPNQNVVEVFIAAMNDTAKARGKKLFVYGRGGPSDVLQMPWSGNDNELAARGYQIMPHNSGSVTQHLVTFQDPPYNTIMLYSGFQGAYEFDLTRDKHIAPENVKQVFAIHTLTWQHWHYMHFFDLRKLMASISENAWNYNRRDKFLPFDQWRDTRWAATNARLDDLVFPVKVKEAGLLSPGKDITFEGSMTVELSCKLPGTIRYVQQKLDYMSPPPLPTKDSPAYSGPIQISEPTSIYAALFDQSGQMIAHGSERHYWPITPVVTCSAWDGRAIRQQLNQDMPNLAQPSKATQKEIELPGTLDELQKLKIPPTYQFPMGRISYQPSYQGVYFQGWMLLEEGTIQVPAAGDYEFSLAPVQSTLYIDGQFAASIAGEGKNAAKKSEKVKLTAGEHRLQWLAATGSKFRGPIVTVRKAGEDEKAGKPIEPWLLPLKAATAAK